MNKIISVSALLIVLAGCASQKSSPVKKDITLIMGLHMDETIWKDVEEKLALQNFRVTKINRAGRDIKQLVSLKKIATISCEQTPASSIVVAHSFGGAIVNMMTGLCPEKIKQIIYVSGLIPLKGEKPFDHTSKSDQKEYAKAVSIKNGKFHPRTIKYFFSVTDMTYKFDLATSPKLYPESVGLNAEAISYDPNVYAGIPKAYIYTGRDKLVGLKTQETYTLKSQITKTATLPTGHYPMLSSPEVLTQEIIKLSL